MAKDIKTLTQWLRRDVLELAGHCLATRIELFDFVTAELAKREHFDTKRRRPVCVALRNQRDDLLAFAGVLDSKLEAIAKTQRCQWRWSAWLVYCNASQKLRPLIGRVGANCVLRWGTSVMLSLRP